ncbi:MAG: hypothetical protein LUE24_13980 [Lachnospiraceae bacterium]|nr:hypothetical protein [Lachnospiraceae bacterium]
MDIYYLNTAGEKIILSEWPIAVTDLTQLYGRKWKTSIKENKAKSRASVLYTYRTTAEFKLDISIYADSKSEYEEVMNNFEAVTDYDVANNTPGKLYVGEYYLPCFIRDTSPSDYEELFYTVNEKLTVYSTNPHWLREAKNSYIAHTEESSGEEQEYLNFDYNFDYNYASTSGYGALSNETNTGCDFLMTIYGAIENPAIYINGHLYQVYVTLGTNEYLTIDSRDSTIVLTSATGKTTNVYSLRNQDSYIFQQIPAGTSTVYWAGTFGFDITLFEKRSEPLW